MMPPQRLWADRPDRHVILIDTYEFFLAPLDNSLREGFLPQLPENVLVVLAGRNPPSPGWRADPGWQILVRVAAAPQSQLRMRAACTFEQRSVPGDQSDAVLQLHPRTPPRTVARG